MEPVLQVGAGIGLNRTFQLYNRWYVELSSLAVVSKTFIPASSSDVIVDTGLNNENARYHHTLYPQDNMTILYPTQIPHPISLRLKNKLLLNYYFSKTIGMNLSFVYNIGIPNTMFIYQFDYYSPFNRDQPESHEKVVVSNSSFAWSLGLTVNLWN